MKIAVVSPHLDDAVFSVGERMIQQSDIGNEITIVCPIAEIPYAQPHHSKYETLIAEHHKACDAMGWKSLEGCFYDDAVEEQSRAPRELMPIWLQDALDHVQPDRVWSPSGIHHPDHLWVAQSMPRIIDVPWFVYDELPYYSLYPEIQTNHGAFVNYQRGHLITGRKRWLCNMYESQMQSPDLENHLYLPERLWVA